MPIQGGLEATQEIRSIIEPEKQPWIIALTASCMAIDCQNAEEAGLDGILPKPLSLKLLAAALKTIVNARRFETQQQETTKREFQIFAAATGV